MTKSLLLIAIALVLSGCNSHMIAKQSAAHTAPTPQTICPPEWVCEVDSPEKLNVIPDQQCDKGEVSMLGMCVELPPVHSEPQGVCKI